MKLEFISLARVLTNPNNPRQITKERFEKLIDSILVLPRMLELRPVIVDDSLVALGGNMRRDALAAIANMPMAALTERLSALRDFRRKTEERKKALLAWWEEWQKERRTIPIIRASELTPEEMREFVIKDNAAYGDWDWDALANEWDTEDLQEWGLDVSDFAPAAGDGASEASEDDFDEDTDVKETRAKLGDIWRLGDHRLCCGDSTDPALVALLMDGEKADMVFTDPPYGVAIGDKNKEMKKIKNSGMSGVITENIENDALSAEELYPILVKAMTNCRENCTDSAVYYVTAPQGGDLGLMMLQMMKEAGLPVRHNLIWKKNTATFSIGRLDYDYQHEPIFYTWTKSHKNYREGEFRTTIWEIPKPQKCDLHPTMKPVALVANCLKDGSRAGDVVLDMFGESGTTIVAAEQLGRRCRMMELDPHYCDVIISRWEKLTGREAVRVSEGLAESEKGGER
ncbi:MAG: site-specific DNA-methyltransferase [Bacteroidales bacterium]|nr:site-specific DNA-methyltransferase [Bacteroidales bacterium]